MEEFSREYLPKRSSWPSYGITIVKGVTTRRTYPAWAGREKVMDKTSMLYWWPIVKDLGIPVPKTEIVEVPYEHLIGLLDGKPLPEEYFEAVLGAKDLVGFPLFLRTDMASAKHHWEETCYISEMKELFKHIWSLIDNTLAAGMFGELDPNALVFREYVPMATQFTAFWGKLPINPERRYFIRDGIVECHHSYWIEDAISKSGFPPSVFGWKQILAAMNEESGEEVGLLSWYAIQVARVLPGYWSVDFCKARDGRWILIDLAEGEKSWHPEHTRVD